MQSKGYFKFIEFKNPVILAAALSRGRKTMLASCKGNQDWDKWRRKGGEMTGSATKERVS